VRGGFESAVLEGGGHAAAADRARRFGEDGQFGDGNDGVVGLGGGEVGAAFFVLSSRGG
jgi:hypothetical protein